MAWIESHQSLSRHRKTLRAAALLRVNRHQLIGHLHELWWWALDNVPADGNLGDLTDLEIAQGAEWSGDPTEFVRALTDAGFIDETDDGRYLHDWYDYAGKYLEKRAQDAERKRVARRKSGGRPADVQLTSAGRPQDVLTYHTIPNHTVPNHSEGEEEEGGAPPGERNGETPDDTPVNWIRWYEERTTRLPSRSEIADADALIQRGVTHELIIAMIERAIELKRSAPAAWAIKRLADLQAYNIRTVEDLHRFESEQQQRARDAPGRARLTGFDALMAIMARERDGS